MNDLERTNVDQRFKLAIQRMKVRRRMLTPEHLDDDAKELADRRQGRSGAHGFKSVVINIVGRRLAAPENKV